MTYQEDNKTVFALNQGSGVVNIPVLTLLKNNTYVFTEDLKGDMTIILDWDDLPEHARLYIMTKAGRELQENMIGSKDLTEINLVLEQEARSQFLEEETTLSEHSMLRGHARRTHPVLGYKPINVMQR